MTGKGLVDEVARLLAADEPVPPELAADLIAAMPREEREHWLRTLMGLADNLEEAH